MATTIIIVNEEEQKNDKELKKHGGQDWKLLTNYIEDFSVTTNGLPPPQSGINAIQQSCQFIDHYPAMDHEPALTDLASFIWRDDQFEKRKSSLILGNGASELVDILMRVLAENNVKSFRPGPTKIQYKDYERCAILNKFEIKKSSDDSADVLSMINPTNPTGDFMKINEIKKYIEEHAENDSFVVVDESMIFWYGENWRSQSLSSQHKWIENMYLNKNIAIIITMSWTKIWKCCGIRIGSLIAPNKNLYSQIKTKQTPWSVNVLGLSFISACSKDEEYMKRTWRVTKLWRANMVKEIKDIFNDDKNIFNVELFGQDFISWIWVDTHNKELVKLMVAHCLEYGVPIRDAAHGYKQETCVRFGVREFSSQKVLFKALKHAKSEYLKSLQ